MSKLLIYGHIIAQPNTQIIKYNCMLVFLFTGSYLHCHHISSIYHRLGLFDIDYLRIGFRATHD